MNAIQTNRLERYLEGYGLVELPFDQCASKINGLQIAKRATFKVIGLTTQVDEVLKHLALLTDPPTMHALFPLGKNCTVFINNGKNGSDFANYAWYSSLAYQCRVVRVVDCPGRKWTDGSTSEILAYEARVIEFYNQEGNVTKSVSCLNDGGRWSFYTTGTAMPIETSFNYTAKRRQDRFTKENVKSLLAANGFPIINTRSCLDAGEYLLVREETTNKQWYQKIMEKSCSIEQRDDPAHGYYERGLSYTEHLNTHAESVIADFEKAVRLNSNYEPLVREYLTRAKEIIKART